ncbi:MAG: ribonuclease HII [Thomasclavelia sp.]|nr:ribonuclease HII [Thomasclavelia sp.]
MLRYEYEQKYYDLGYKYILGTDEAGRGPMAGELVVAGVVFPKNFYDERINDSKQLTEKKRKDLYQIIIDNALYYNIEVISVEDVDKLNVYKASKLGMENCVKKCSLDNLFVLTDAMKISFNHHEAIIKGDAKSISIAAASILAKVTRDELMKKHALEYPMYQFDKHKGYVTKLHKELLHKYGPCPLHRKSFKPVQECMEIKLPL